MSETPRSSRYQIPLPTRNSDVSQLFDCPLSWALKHFHEDELRDTTYFTLGTVAHTVIQRSIEDDLTLDQSLNLARSMLDDWQVRTDLTEVMETSSRTVDTMQDDAERMTRNWFRFVHPDSEDRLPIYDDYAYPPKVEVSFYRSPEQTGTEYPVWGRVDTVWTRKPNRNVPEHMVVDWKSSVRRQWTSNQLDFYRYGLDMPGAAAVFHYLDRERASYVVEHADAYPGDEVVRQRVLAAEAIKLQIMESKMARAVPGGHCRTCVSKPFCPRYGDYKAKEEKMATLRENLKVAKPLVEIEGLAA